MTTVGVVGLGDMGIGMAGNLAKSGFTVLGHDLRDSRLDLLEELGGERADGPADIGARSDIAFVMVMNGAQAMDVITQLKSTMAPGKAIAITATIKPNDVRDLERALEGTGIDLIDSPVSGGKAGADNGTLTLMLAAKAEVLERNRPALEAISGKIFHVGEEIGQGQTVKASLQAVFGAYFGGIFEGLVLGSKAGVSGQVLHDVFTHSALASPMLANCTKLIMDRKFEGTGSHIGTMYKDLGITMGLAREVGAAMFTTSAAYELFQTGKAMYPDGDNWTIVRVLEQIADTEVKW
ncbi:MAG: NAD(P)-dependent oxidoreductase [Alphaproteobacteria bacterium]|nr:NAD(P)-dependent oxidoreductase [Alphaproteobacteria bacterium]